jgi:hypothetical protein
MARGTSWMIHGLDIQTAWRMHAGTRERLITSWRHYMLLQAFQLRGAGAVLHSHSTNAVMATMLDERATEFHVTQLEMVKVGIQYRA